jgi:hypothetical protein
MKRGLETAYHEAGHAVACVVLHLPFTQVTIVPEGDTLGMVSGHTSPKSLDPDAYCSQPGRQRARVEADVLSCLCGGLAFLIFRGGKDDWRRDGSRWDLSQALSLLEKICGSAPETEAYLNLLRIRAEQLLRFPPNWSAVQALAEALMESKTIGSRKARKIVKQAIGDFDWESVKVANWLEPMERRLGSKGRVRGKKKPRPKR